MSERILVVAAHPDDETLGLGGTIARFVSAGHEVGVMFFTDGVGSRGTDTDAVQRRRLAAERAAEVLGHRILYFGGYPDNGLDTVPLLTLCRTVETVRADFQPQRVFIHHGGDLNIDHQRAAQAALTAFRPVPGESCHLVASFGVLSSTGWSSVALSRQFCPNYFVDISDYVDLLVEAYQAYAEEIRDDPHARSVEALTARVSYFGRLVGCAAAEPFELVRRVVY